MNIIRKLKLHIVRDENISMHVASTLTGLSKNSITQRVQLPENIIMYALLCQLCLVYQLTWTVVLLLQLKAKYIQMTIIILICEYT